MWQALENFSNADPPTLLWRGQLKYAALFRFLAPLFLLASDHVLDTERVHARWQWMCNEKRNQTMQSFNAELRLRHFLEHNQALPTSASCSSTSRPIRPTSSCGTETSTKLTRWGKGSEPLGSTAAG